jgi:hypothetical protein
MKIPFPVTGTGRDAMLDKATLLRMPGDVHLDPHEVQLSFEMAQADKLASKPANCLFPVELCSKAAHVTLAKTLHDKCQNTWRVTLQGTHSLCLEVQHVLFTRITAPMTSSLIHRRSANLALPSIPSCITSCACLSVIVIVMTIEDSASNSMLPGSSHCCCIRNLHALNKCSSCVEHILTSKFDFLTALLSLKYGISLDE